jgi:hypothetical protein
MAVSCRIACARWAGVAMMLVLAGSRRGPAQAAAAPSVGPCRLPVVDTSGWVATRSFELGVAFSRPPSYRLKIWESSRLPFPTVEWWRDDGPQYTLSISLTRSGSDSARQEFLKNVTDAQECMLVGAGGPARALLYRSGRAYDGQGEPVVPYLLVAEWPTGGGRVIHLVGASLDSLGRAEQLAIARTLRVVDTTLRR